MPFKFNPHTKKLDYYVAPTTPVVTWGTITGTLSTQLDVQSALDGKVDENAAITGATKTKITYDAKGLVTAGADATTADINDTTNLRYVTDADLILLSNTSGVNTGDQSLAAYLTSATAAATYYPLGNPAGYITSFSEADPVFTASEAANFASGDKTKLDGIAAGAEVNVNADWSAGSGDAEILNKPTIPTLTSQLTNDSGFLTSAPVTSVNTFTGAVVLDADDIDDAATSHKFVTSGDLTTLSNTSGTNSGDQTSIVGISGTKAQFDTAVSDGNILYVGDITQYTDEMAQDAVGGILTDSSEIDFTYNDALNTISASIIAGSIDETKLDISTNASLDLADSALQASAIGVTVQGYSSILANITASFLTTDEAKIDFISVTQAVNLDTMESDIVTNNAKVTNATHTGEVTGSGALTLDKTAITNRTLVSVSNNDKILISDDSDSDNLKYVTANDLQSFIPHNGEVTGYTSLTLDKTAITTKGAATVASGDLVLISDISDSNNLKQVTAGSIASLSAGSFIPYTGATGDVGLGVYDLTATDATLLGDLNVGVTSNLGTVITVFGTNVNTQTVDGADTQHLDFCGGGSPSKERGARLILFGNEASLVPGDAYLDAGNITGSRVYIRQNDVTKMSFGSADIAASVDVTVPDEAYGVGWNGSLEVPTKNATYDKISSLITFYGNSYAGTVESRTAEANFTTHAVSSVVVPTGANVYVHITGMMSHGTANGDMNIRARRDSTGLGFWHSAANYRANTAGADTPFSVIHVDTPSAGTYTYGLRGYSSSGTMYVRTIQIRVVVVAI